MNISPLKFVAHLALSTALTLAAESAIAAAPTSHPMAPAIERYGKNLGPEAPSTPLSLTVWLNLHNKAELDARVQALYTLGSPTFHKWLSLDDLKAYTPTEAEVAAVKQELVANNLKVTSVDPLHMSVRFTGRTSDVERAFHTQVNKYSVKGEMVHTSSSVPALSGEAASLVQHLGGLNSVTMKPHIKLAKDLGTGKTVGVRTYGALKPAGAYFSSQCFYDASTVTISGVSDVDYSSPSTGTYTGLMYGAPASNTTLGTIGPCGYSAADVSNIYGLDKAYALGLKGQGQSIVIVDAFLEDLALPDANDFNTLESLPPLSPRNYQTYNPDGAYIEGFQDGTNWNVETALDVEWAHAVAPGANIKLVQAYSSDSIDLQSAVLYAITNNLGNVITNSYGGGETEEGILTAQIWDQINELGASRGISVQYSTGDTGDFSAGTSTPEVSTPSNSPYATAIGGTTVAILPSGQILTTGWGNNINYVDDGGLIISGPDEDGVPDGGFYGGGGGGTSNFFAKPAYQSALPGPGRHLPDVSALADPFTGAEFVYSAAPGVQYVSVTGGTSLASPIFAGIWSMVDQAVGTSLGQAAPYIAAAPSPIIEDVLPFAGPDHVAGTVTSKYGTVNLSEDYLSEPLFTTGQFSTALYVPNPYVAIVLSFGTDTTLTITQGWDNVTGYGTPNVGAAIDLLTQLKK